DDRELPIAPLGSAIQAVAGSARLLVNHRSMLADQTVEQSRLADVGSPNERHDRHPPSLPVLAALATATATARAPASALAALRAVRPRCASGRSPRASIQPVPGSL